MRGGEADAVELAAFGGGRAVANGRACRGSELSNAEYDRPCFAARHSASETARPDLAPEEMMR